MLEALGHNPSTEKKNALWIPMVYYFFKLVIVSAGKELYNLIQLSSDLEALSNYYSLKLCVCVWKAEQQEQRILICPSLHPQFPITNIFALLV